MHALVSSRSVPSPLWLATVVLSLVIVLGALLGWETAARASQPSHAAPVLASR